MIDNSAQHRFELTENGLTVFADYRAHDSIEKGRRYVLTHIEAEPAMRGTGAASRLMEQIVAFARAGNAKLVPRCPYAVAWFKRHAEAADLIG